MNPLTEEERDAVERHLRLVYYVARKTPVGEFDDRVQDGVLGLISAIRRYDPDRGASLVTYAVPMIRGRILEGHRRRTPGTRTHMVDMVSLDVASLHPPDLLWAEDDPAEQAVAAADAQPRAEALHAALAQLNPALAEAALTSVTFGGQRRIATRDHVTEGAITHRKNKALARLRKLLRDLERRER